MTVAYYYHIPALERGSSVITSSSQARTIRDMAHHSGRVLLLAHRPARRETVLLDDSLSRADVELISLPALPHPVLAWLLGPVFMVIVSRRIRADPKRAIDLTVLRGPSTLLGWIARAIRGPKVLLIVGDFFAWTRSERRGGLRRMASVVFAWARWLDTLTIARKATVLVNGKLAMGQWRRFARRVILVNTNSLARSEAQLRSDTCLSPEIRLLFVGRVVVEKGIIEAIAVCRELREAGFDATLRVIGPISDPDLQNDADAHISFGGQVDYGRGLFREYADADILLCLSHYESFPRVIWEAFAFGVPVVATDVGSIRATLGDDAAVLVPPLSVHQAFLASQRIVLDGPARRLRIARGRAALGEMERETPSVGRATASILAETVERDQE